FGPQLLITGQRRELRVDLTPGVPQEPGHGVVVPAGMGGEDVRIEPPAQRGDRGARTGGEVTEDVEGVHASSGYSPPSPTGSPCPGTRTVPWQPDPGPGPVGRARDTMLDVIPDPAAPRLTESTAFSAASDALQRH